MKVVYLKGFEKDLSKINNKKIAIALKVLLENIENANTLTEIPNIKKLKGHKNAYRIRLGNFRIGLFYQSNQLILAAFDSRKDIYKKFP